MHGPYIFGSICGAYFMQHNYNLSTNIHPGSIPPTELPFSSTLSPDRTSPPISPTTQTPFQIISGSCTKNYAVSHNKIIHCVQSPNYPEYYPSAESCHISIPRYRRGDSLTATDFATRVDDTLQVRWKNYYANECGNEGIMSANGDLKYDPHNYDSYGYLNFSGLVGGPCNFTCTSSTDLTIKWWSAAKPGNSIITAKGWKLCYEPATFTPFGTRTDFNLQCAAPSPFCAPEFYVAFLWASYIGVGFLFLISLFVCYCGRSLGACVDACCLFNCGVARCCCDVCFNACLRADVVAQGREKAIHARVSAQHAAYNKVASIVNRTSISLNEQLRVARS